MDNSLLNEINLQEAGLFINNSNTDIVIKKNDEKVTYDYTWLDFIENAVTYIDAIILNPKRFLIQESEVIPVEKTKKVTRESIKHLSQHTSLIQSVEEDGSVYPEKLLNIYKEETFDLYENRFMATLINRLYNFIERQLESTDESHESKKRSVKYYGKTKIGKENINIAVNLETSFYTKLDQSDTSEIIKRKNDLYEVVEEFINGEFMKIMKPAAPVKNPIRKTNTLLKNENFRHALELWEYLDKIEDDIPTVKNAENIEIKNNVVKNDFDFAYFLNYYSLTNHLDGQTANRPVKNKEDVDQILKDYIYNNDLEAKNLKNKFNELLNKTIKERLKVRREIKNKYEKYINLEIKRIKKSILYLK